ncbi:MAG: hypothetical protein F6K26_45185 [Moorea sp. SIO2I5]|nr:hypothetical protein [Moorena sp. SIO2I5]
MATSPLSPRLLRGAIVALDPANPLASVIILQYNPETMTRSLTPRTAGADLSAQGKSDLDPTEASGIAMLGTSRYGIDLWSRYAIASY